jgi:nucleoside-diphosphate-sugar epimerase
MNGGGSAKTALVLGATGGIGGETAAALARHGWRVIAMARKLSAGGAAGALDGVAGDAVRWVAGDALRAEDVRRAAEGARVIVHAVNPPGYRNWAQLVLPMIDNTIAAARAVGARVVLPGTVYNFGPDAFPLLTEDSPQHPITRKGKIRLALEEKLQEAAGDGVTVMIVRFGDFFGPNAGNNWLTQGLVKPGRRLDAITTPGARGVGHAWAYLPDAAEAIARLLERDPDLPAFARFHFAGHWDADGTAMPAAIRNAVGRPETKTRPMPWALLWVGGLFNETLRELREMRYLWRVPVQLDGARLAAFLGGEPHTPLADAIKTTLAAQRVT